MTFLMIRRPPRSTPKPSSAASDVYKRQPPVSVTPVSYTHLRAHETSLHIVCRLRLEKPRLTKGAEDDVSLCVLSGFSSYRQQKSFESADNHLGISACHVTPVQHDRTCESGRQKRGFCSYVSSNEELRPT